MDRNEWEQYIKGQATDFLNCEKPTEFKGETLEGFYIEINDVIDMMRLLSEIMSSGGGSLSAQKGTEIIDGKKVVKE